MHSPLVDLGADGTFGITSPIDGEYIGGSEELASYLQTEKAA